MQMILGPPPSISRFTHSSIVQLTHADRLDHRQFTATQATKDDGGLYNFEHHPYQHIWGALRR